MARQVLENGVILPAEYSDDWYDDMTSNLTKLDDVIGSDSEKLSSADVGAAALSNNYNDLDNLPTIPTVNDATLTIQKNGVDVQTFTANASSNVTCNITVPTKTSDLTNDSNFVVSSSLANVATSGDYDDLSNKPSIPTNTSDLTNDSNFVDTSNPAVSSGITSAKVTDYDTHIADTDIHVTTADKDRWNNQTYVFRYSSTALVASSTNSNALLDNTDNLKVGDKVIDSSGVLFSITAIDTQNSTFTIGTALIDLAQDSDVVHTSGDETVGGVKTFTNPIKIKKEIELSGNRLAYILPDFTASYSGLSLCTYDASGAVKIGIWKVDNNDNTKHVLNDSLGYLNITTGSVNSVNTVFLTPRNASKAKLGDSVNKWHEINGVEPSSLSLPSGNVSDVIDISSYITDLSGNINNYTAPANGWITITMSNCTGIHAYITDLWGDSRVRASAGAIKFLMPVLKNQTATFLVFGGSIDNARFIPCQGNV